MIYNNLTLTDGYEILPEPYSDDRGFFSRIFCLNENKKLGIVGEIKQINNSFNKHKGTIRGFHYQINGYEECKFMRAIHGKFFCVNIDLRINSKTFLKTQSLEVCSKKRNIICVPMGCASAIQTLENDTEFLYFSTQFYSPENERGIKYDDKYFKIDWPLACSECSIKDKSWPDFDTDNNKNLI